MMRDLRPFVASPAPKSYIEHGYKGGKNRICLRHGATSVVDREAPTPVSMCKDVHSHAIGQERIARRPIASVAYPP